MPNLCHFCQLICLWHFLLFLVCHCFPIVWLRLIRSIYKMLDQHQSSCCDLFSMTMLSFYCQVVHWPLLLDWFIDFLSLPVDFPLLNGFYLLFKKQIVNSYLLNNWYSIQMELVVFLIKQSAFICFLFFYVFFVLFFYHLVECIASNGYILTSGTNEKRYLWKRHNEL